MKNLLNLRKKEKIITKRYKASEKKTSYLTERLEEMDAILDRQEQYSRRNRLLIHGVNEVEGKDTDELSMKVIEEL